MRYGVHRGSDLPAIWPIVRRTYPVMIDAVDLSARLMAKAGRPHLRDGRRARSINTVFATTELALVRGQGQGAARPAWSVGRAIGSRARQAWHRSDAAGRPRYRAECVREALAMRHGGTAQRSRSSARPASASPPLEPFVEYGDGLSRAARARARRIPPSTRYPVWHELVRDAWGSATTIPTRRSRDRLATTSAPVRLTSALAALIAIAFGVEFALHAEVEMLAERPAVQAAPRRSAGSSTSWCPIAAGCR